MEVGKQYLLRNWRGQGGQSSQPFLSPSGVRPVLDALLGPRP